jgi:hypothetical protein
MQMKCERRGQGEIGILTHGGQVFAAFGAGVYGHNITGYTHQHNGRITLTRWDGSTMLACRSEIVEDHDGSIALVFRLTRGRYVIGYALGGDGMLFRGELLTACDDDRARHEALELADYWSEIDAEDATDPWHGDPGENEFPDW